jgi:hypothetical protein
MITSLSSNSLLNEIVEEISKLDEFEQEQILTNARIRNYLKTNNKPTALYDKNKIKPPTMAQIDKWKHDSRLSK